ncbi:hypothetical protein Q4Q35_09805 [Flavivirga aquimarina]|uniref:Uncharacterized protein n=1 Tax=Flavivirga aquimarina TaxID=2027862 RepID=A0ABT8WAC9_9FLAO|nr:hypothetical protein [Flavivirga aquimarina]MDO5970101.1 hypothetical protein [Flavivirga aquimarina]
MESKKIGKLEYKSKVIIKKVLPNKFETILDEGLKISSNWIQIENPANPKLESYIFGGFLNQKKLEVSSKIDTTNWVGLKLKKHNISLKQPKNWINITSKTNSYYNWNKNNILITHEDGIDPTQVIIKIQNNSLAESERNLLGKEWFKKIEELIINNKKVIKCTFFFDNQCSNIQYLHKITENKLMIIEVSGTCVSHSKEYDETKIKVAESIKY